MGEVRVIIPDKVEKYIESLVRTGMFSTKAEMLRAALMEYVDKVSSIARGYDSSLIFSPEGRIYQIEYAREASFRGSPAVGIAHKTGIIFVARVEKRRDKNRKEIKGIEYRKIFKFHGKYLLTFSGLAADGYHIIENVRKKKFKDDDEILGYISHIYWKFTISPNLRPLGTVIMLGLKESKRIVWYDTSGAYTISKFGAVGDGSEEIMALLNENYKEVMSKKEAKNLALKALENPKEYEVGELQV